MSNENNKRVHINEDGILTITNDNANWVNGDVTTEIKGDYNISADALNKLIVMMTENPMMICHTHTGWYNKDYSPKVYNTLITTDKDIVEEIEKINIAYKKAHDELEVVKRERDLEKFTRVSFEKKIEEFNKSRHWWERKITF